MNSRIVDGGPVVRVRDVDERVDQRDHARDRHHRADEVELALQPLAFVQVAERAGDQDDADRHVDEQHPSPVEVLGEDAAEQQAERRARTGGLFCCFRGWSEPYVTGIAGVG